jgi:carbon storage regulator CsrA
MMVLSRRMGECISIGKDIVVTGVEINGNPMGLEIDASREVRVPRDRNRTVVAALGTPRRKA